MQDDQNELLLIVDKDDNVIGSEIRSIVHKKKLFHRSIHVLIFNLEEKIYLQKRGLMKDESPGLWACSVSGHVDYGETYDEACIREIEEEVGITMRPHKANISIKHLRAEKLSWVISRLKTTL